MLNAIATGFSASPQLYNLKSDIGETKNIDATFTEQSAKMQKTLEDILHSPTRKRYAQKSETK